MTVARRNTWQREAVREALVEAPGFVSAQQLHEQLRMAGSTIGLATVYRTLASFEETGEADTIQAGGETQFRACSMEDHHHHLVCRVCGATHELASEKIETWARRMGNEYGFADITHVVDLFGVCPECQNAQRAASA